MSGTKKMPNTDSTASNDCGARSRSRMSAHTSSTLVKPAASTRVRAMSSICCVRSTPSTAPDAPTAFAAGSTELPVPHATSSTRAPGTSASRSTVSWPKRGKNDWASVS